MSAISTQDLRSSAKPYQREKDHTVKWRDGKRFPNPCSRHQTAEANCTLCFGIPNYRGRKTWGGREQKRLFDEREDNRATTLARRVFHKEVVEAMDDPLAHVSDNSSEGEDVYDVGAPSSAGEADYMYSYDAPSGPRAGRDLLSNAIAQAVSRFENIETEKLVNKEYDVVNAKEMTEAAADDEVDDFELIDHSHLN